MKWALGWLVLHAVQAWDAADTMIADYFACMGESPDDRD